MLNHKLCNTKSIFLDRGLLKAFSTTTTNQTRFIKININNHNKLNQITKMNNNNNNNNRDFNKYKRNNYNNNSNNNNNNNDRPRPTHFIGLKVENLSLETIANQLKSKHPRLGNSFIVKEKYHLSVIILTLDTEEKLNSAKGLLQTIKEIHQKRYSLNNLLCKAQISGIGSFNERVLWAGLKADQDKVNLVDFVNEIRELYKLNQFEIDNRDWSPHITLAKGKFLKSMIDAPFTLALKNNEFGSQDFKSMDLMKIGSTNIDGYYEIIDTVQFN